MTSLTQTNIRFCGDPVSPENLSIITSVISDCSGLSRTELASTICELLEWQRPTGQLKTVECRAFLEELAQKSLVQLPPAREGRPRGSRTTVAVLESDAPVLRGSKRAFEPLELIPVVGAADRAQWRALVERHHYLGHKVPFGAHLRYFIQVHGPQPVTVGCLQFSSPAWRMAARDRYLGWDDPTRTANLQRLVSNSRFLILPTVQIKNLASSVLALAAARLADDWEHHFGVRPLLLETLVDTTRFRGTCYRAANWVEVGLTTGRGRNDRQHRHHGAPPKTVFLYPLTSDAVARLRRKG